MTGNEQNKALKENNTLKIGDIVLSSSSLDVQELVEHTLGLLKSKEVKDYLGVVRKNKLGGFKYE